MIAKGELYFAPVHQLNDPFEYRWRDTLPTNHDEIVLYTKELLAANFPFDSIAKRRQRFNELLPDIEKLAAQKEGKATSTVTAIFQGVFCASEINDDILMWSHYASNHTGVCVSILPTAVKRKRFFPVLYSEEVPVVDGWEYIRPKPGLFVKLSRTKARHWNYEKEWRTIHTPGPVEFPGCVDCVIIGAMASPAVKQEVQQFVASTGLPIKVVTATRSETHYRVDIRIDD